MEDGTRMDFNQGIYQVQIVYIANKTEKYLLPAATPRLLLHVRIYTPAPPRRLAMIPTQELLR